MFKSTSSIKDEFDKIELYKLKTQNNNNLIEAKKSELNTRTSCRSSEPFVYLKEVDELDIIKKQIANLHTANDNMKKELVDLPNTIRRKLCKSIRQHFAILEHNKKVEQKKNELFRAKCTKIVKLSSVVSGLVVISFLARRAILSRR